jgi:hypothetical protein
MKLTVLGWQFPANFSKFETAQWWNEYILLRTIVKNLIFKKGELDELETFRAGINHCWLSKTIFGFKIGRKFFFFCEFSKSAKMCIFGTLTSRNSSSVRFPKFRVPHICLTFQGLSIDTSIFKIKIKKISPDRDSNSDLSRSSPHH